LSPHTSQLGMLFCRTIANKADVINHLTDRKLRHEDMILIFDDEMVKALTFLRLDRNVDGIQSMLRKLTAAVEYRNPDAY
jgi:hypothetical protein